MLPSYCNGHFGSIVISSSTLIHSFSVKFVNSQLCGIRYSTVTVPPHHPRPFLAPVCFSPLHEIFDRGYSKFLPWTFPTVDTRLFVEAIFIIFFCFITLTFFLPLLFSAFPIYNCSNFVAREYRFEHSLQWSLHAAWLSI